MEVVLGFTPDATRTAFAVIFPWASRLIVSGLGLIVSGLRTNEGVSWAYPRRENQLLARDTPPGRRG